MKKTMVLSKKTMTLTPKAKGKKANVRKVG